MAGCKQTRLACIKTRSAISDPQIDEFILSHILIMGSLTVQSLIEKKPIQSPRNNFCIFGFDIYLGVLPITGFKLQDLSKTNAFVYKKNQLLGNKLDIYR